MIDVDVNDRTKTPCQTEGCNWPSYHVCLVGKPDLFPKLLKQRKKQTNWSTAPASDETRAAISEANLSRWAAIREANRERDEAIVARYAEGTIGMKELGKEFGVHINGVRKILWAAAEAGLITIRKSGGRVNKRNPELEGRVINRYNEGNIGIEPLALELGLTRDIVRRILLVAQDEGLTIIRPRGATVAKTAA